MILLNRFLILVFLSHGADLLAERNAHSVAMLVDVEFSERAYQPSSAFYRINEGEAVTVSRLSLLLSGISLLEEEGSWVEVEHSVAWYEPSEGQMRHMLGKIAEGTYSRIRFQLGLDEALDLKDPAFHPADHPLNPAVNGLHWGMADSGFVYLAVEGRRRMNAGESLGFSYHLATQKARTQYDLPVELAVDSEGKEVRLKLDLGAIFHGVSPSSDGSSTHSAEGDPLAEKLIDNLPGLFPSVSVSKGGGEVSVSEEALRVSAKEATPMVVKVSPLLPRMQSPKDNPLTVEGVSLGERLFREVRLSGDDTVSCASCHREENALGDTVALSEGIKGRIGQRNAMPLFNLAWKKTFFWDGRTERLRDLVFDPWEHPDEMGGDPEEDTAQIAMDEEYKAAFAAAFEDGKVSKVNVSLAIEQFLFSQVSQTSHFDDVIRGKARFTEKEQRGYEIFHLEFDPREGKRGADCFHCHGGVLFTNHRMHNNGLDSLEGAKDMGLGGITGNPTERLMFSTPSLRNLAKTAPYMHDGRFGTIREVLEHYNAGVVRSETLDPNLSKHPTTGLDLSDDDMIALEAFLMTLTEN